MTLKDPIILWIITETIVEQSGGGEGKIKSNVE